MATDVNGPSAKDKDVWRQLRANPYILGLSAVSRRPPRPLDSVYSPLDLFTELPFAIQFASLGGFLFGYDQGVVSGVLTMESFAAQFPRVYLDAGYKGWFVSTLLLLAWLGSLVNGPISDNLGRKGSMLLAVVVFVVGAALQAGGANIETLFAGRAVAGFAVGMLTMVVPQYMCKSLCVTVCCEMDSYVSSYLHS